MIINYNNNPNSVILFVAHYKIAKPLHNNKIVHTNKIYLYERFRGAVLRPLIYEQWNEILTVEGWLAGRIVTAYNKQLR